MQTQNKTQINALFVQLIFYSFVTKVPIEKAPKLFVLFFENYFVFPFFYCTFAMLNGGN